MIDEKTLVSFLSKGISLDTNRPFLSLAERLNATEEEVMEKIRELLQLKKIKRFGAVVLSRSLGRNQNAMVTLKVNEDDIARIGEQIASYDFVTLCYERKTVSGVWEYNLYFMIHGSDRDVVKSQIETVLKEQNIDSSQCEVLFSTKCFKQKGASY